jgi:hypothetical protein
MRNPPGPPVLPGRIAPILLPLLPLLLAACVDVERASTAVVRDSAGVEIVESPGPAWRGGAGWRIAPEPSLVMGVVDGPEAFQFSSIRSAFYLPDGGIVAANTQNPPELRVFGSDGEHRVSMGGAGGGPGEFSVIFRAFPAGDTLVAVDPIGPRITYFAPDGRLLATQPVRFPSSDTRSSIPYVIWARLVDGSLLITDNRTAPVSVTGDGRATMALLRTSVDGAGPDTLLTIPGASYRAGQGGHPEPVPFGLSWAFHVRGDRVFVGAGDALRVEVHDLDGRLLRSMRAHYDRRPVTDAALAALLETRLAGARTDDDRRRIQASFGTSPPASLMPAHGSAILVDALDHIWVEGYVAPGDASRSWHVFDPNGRYLGEVDVPREMRVTDVGADRVLGVWTDELDVPFVRVYELFRGTGE